MAAHDRQRYVSYGRAVAYHERDDGLDVEFLVTDADFAHRVLSDPSTVEFSVGYLTDEQRATVAFLYEVTAVLPPRRGACPGTRVLGMRTLELGAAELADAQRVNATRIADPADARACYEEIRERFGRPATTSTPSTSGPRKADYGAKRMERQQPPDEAPRPRL